ncbi:MAG TPA: DUF2835 family protein [Pseudomonadales bacterium]|nr:DUF2835 family protein [Pseudomonadales bacterium]
MTNPPREIRSTRLDEMVVDLALDPERLKQLYRGVARNVVVRARDGRWVQFPAHALRAHVDARGVHGAFVLRTRDGRLTALDRLDA